MITEIDGDMVKVEFDDGDGIELPRVLLRPLDLKESDPVYCRWKGGPAYYPAKIEEMGGEDIFVNYDDGRTERTTVRMVRVIPDELAR